MSADSPSIYEFLNFAEFISAYHDHRKTKHKGFSYRQLARKAGINTPDYLKSIIKGKRRLVGEKVFGVAAACQLTKQETLYFQALVEWNQAQTSQEKQFAWEKLIKLKPNDNLYILNDNEVNVLSEWYILAIYELIRFPNFKSDVHWISRQLNNRIKTTDIQKALNILLKAGLIKLDGDRFNQIKGGVYKSSEMPSEIIKNYHNMAIQEGLHALFNVDINQRAFASAVISVKKEDLEKLRDEVNRFHKAILIYQENCQDPDLVVQMNVQMFPLTKV